MASQDRASVALHELESTIRSILMQTGSAFAEANKSDIIHLSRTSNRIRQFTPKAIDNMHNQLDVLEVRLQLAQRTLLQGLGAHRAKASGALSAESRVEEVKAQPEDFKDKDRIMADIPPIETEVGVEDFLMNDDLFESPQEATKPETLSNQNPEQEPVTTTTNETTSSVSQASNNEEATTSGVEGSNDIAKDEDQAAEEKTTKATDGQADIDGSKTTTGDANISTQDDKNDINETTDSEQKNDVPQTIDLSDNGNLLSGIEAYANESGMDGFEGMSSFEDINANDLNGQDDLLNGTSGFDDGFGADFQDFQNNSEFESFFTLDDLGNGDTSTGDGQTNLDDFNLDDNFFNLDGT